MVSCLGSLVQSCCREGGALQISLCVGSAHSVPATLGLPCSRVCVLSPSTLLRLPAALYGAGPALRAVPVFGFSTKAQARLRLRFVPSQAGAAQAARSLTRALSEGAVHLLPSVVPASVSTALVGCVRLVFRRDPPGGCRPSRISGSLWLEIGGLCSVVEDAVSGAKFAPFPSPLPPASGRDGLVRRRLALLWSCSAPLF